ncbi:CRISPR system precrRNA processing endoribonuclease RAMP protein Cas6 [Streptomyces sp. NPDC001970]
MATPVQLHGLAATLLESADTDHWAKNKPYSIAPLLTTNHPATATLRLGWLQDTPRPDLTLLTGSRIRLGPRFSTITQATEQFIPYELLRDVTQAHRVVIDFLSATYFSRRSRWYPLPDPVLLYGGLLRRWNHFAPVFAGFDPEVGECLLDSVSLSHHDIATTVTQIGTATRIGFTGRAIFTLARPHLDEAAKAFVALSLFAHMAGVGAQTTHGLGTVKVTINDTEK